MIKQFQFNHFEVNCYLIVDPATRNCAIVDPASEASFEDVQLTQYIEQQGLTVTHILLTHAHVDHIAGLRQCCEHYHLPVSMHAEGRKLLRQAEAYGSIMGFAVDNMGDLEVVELNDNDVLKVGGIEVECRYVPGHCPGSLCFVLPGEKAVITGDALFHYSIGRTDLPGGDYPTLIEKLKTRILTLPDDYRVLPGHGIESLIGKERKYNSFLV
jgi:glyoxylase-like metal-dependent hydrolase (beta-lactamase superfamily II)